MAEKTNHKTPRENSSSLGDELLLTTSINNGMDLGPTVRHSFEAGRTEPLIHQLRIVMKKKESEIEELCKSHYEEFILAVDELRGVLVDAEDLKEEISGGNSRLQEVGNTSLLKINSLLESYSIKHNVGDAIRMSKNCLYVLDLCQKCNEHVLVGRFYHALRILDVLEEKHLENFPVKMLGKLIASRIPLMKLDIEKRVCSEFNEWLVLIRRMAREIGQRAFQQAASVRQKSDINGTEVCLDIDDDDEEKESENQKENSSQKFNLTPMHRALHIHTCLGIQEKFHAYYHKNRLLQLNSDLEISSAQSFLDYYQSFFTQIAGFFIVEDRILRTVALASNQIDAMWETAVTKIISVLMDQISRIDSAPHLLMVKDYVLLFAVTLREYGFQVGPLLETLESSRDTYHELLLRESTNRIIDAIDNDSYEQMMMRKSEDYEADVTTFHLETSEIMPAFPYMASFSSMVPSSCRTIVRFVDESADYLSNGIESGHEQNQKNLGFLRKYLDKLLIDVVNRFLLQKMHDASTTMSRAMQIAANTVFLEQACDFFLHRASLRCGISASRKSQPCLTGKTVLKTSRDAAYLALLNLANAELDDVMALRENIEWTSEETCENGHGYINDVMIYLDTVMSTAQQILPLDAVHIIGCGTLEHFSDSIVAAFLSDHVKRFNGNAVAGINSDLKVLESFADNKFCSTGLSEVYREDLRSCLMEARQLLNLLLSSQPENFLNPVIRERNYSSLDYKKVACICEKFRDAPDGLFGSLGGRNVKHNSRKKSMDTLKRRLRDFN